MDATTHILQSTNHLYARSGASNPENEQRPPIYKTIGILLAVASGLFIGTSFILKKIGLLQANVKYQQEPGEGYGYLKNPWWQAGIATMVIGEICNFVAYAFVDAILVTPLGALSVVVTTILSAIFLKERLSFIGKIGCFNCIVGAVIIGVNAPPQSSVATIQQMKHFVVAPGFLTYMSVVIVACVFIALWAGPRYGKRSMMVYLSICSLIGGLSVVCTQGLGAAIIAQIGGTPQFNQWFLYIVLVFVVATLVTEIIYLNKALNIFNAALVTPTYYVFFTSATIVTSAILFRGFKGSPISIATVVMGFLQICSGVVLLQLSKSAKDVPDTAIFKGDLDQVRTVAEQAQPESEPKADAIRGTAALIRRLSVSRQKMEAEEARRIHEDRQRDLGPIGEDETFEWDGLRRRRTTVGSSQSPGSLVRRKTLHPPLGLTHFPTDDDSEARSSLDDENEDKGVFGSLRKKARSTFIHYQPRHPGDGSTSPSRPVPLTAVSVEPLKSEAAYAPVSRDGGQHTYGLPAALQRPPILSDNSTRGSTGRSSPIRFVDPENDRPGSRLSPGPRTPTHTAKRQFSFQNYFSRHKDNTTHDGAADGPTSPRKSLRSRQHSNAPSHAPTEEEQLGLVTGDSNVKLPAYPSDEDWQFAEKPPASVSETQLPPRITADTDPRDWRESQDAQQIPPRSRSDDAWEGKPGSVKGAFI